MLPTPKKQINSLTRRIASVLGLVFLLFTSTVVHAQQQTGTARLPCGLLCWIIIIIIIIVIIIIIIRFLKGRQT